MATITHNEVLIEISNARYTVVIHPAEEGETGYWAEILELPGCVSQGETEAEVLANIQDAILSVTEPTEIHTAANTPPSFHAYFQGQGDLGVEWAFVRDDPRYTTGTA